MNAIDWLRWAGIIVTCGLGLWLLDQLGLWMERRGWVYYRNTQSSGTAASNALMEFQSFVDPSAENLKYLREEQREERRSDDPLDRNRDWLDIENRNA